MELQLWTISRLGRLPLSLRRDVRFYAPLLDSLDFMGIEPVTFTRASVSARVGRDGQNYAVAVNVPRFFYNGESPRGILLQTGESLQYSVVNALDDANTVIWFANDSPRSTPTTANPFSSSGLWVGGLDATINDGIKFNRILSNVEITQAQAALGEAIQVIPPPPTPPVVSPGVFVNETPV